MLSPHDSISLFRSDILESLQLDSLRTRNIEIEDKSLV